MQKVAFSPSVTFRRSPTGIGHQGSHETPPPILTWSGWADSPESPGARREKAWKHWGKHFTRRADSRRTFGRTRSKSPPQNLKSGFISLPAPRRRPIISVSRWAASDRGSLHAPRGVSASPLKNGSQAKARATKAGRPRRLQAPLRTAKRDAVPRLLQRAATGIPA